METFPNFWDHSNPHPLNTDYQRLYNELVPTMGKSSTLQGEMLRASSRIAYDLYNNGWGNNWTGALYFLSANIHQFPLNLSKSDSERFNQIVMNISDYANCQYAGRNTAPFQKDVTDLIAIITTLVLSNPELIPNDRDMFDLQDADAMENDDGLDDGYDEPELYGVNGYYRDAD
jgi:hypothetical protein